MGDKAVALTRHRADIGAVVAILAQGAAQIRHLDAQIVFPHMQARPDAAFQFRPAQHRPRPFHQRQQQIQGTAAQVNGLSRRQQSAGGIKAVGAEPVDGFGRWRCRCLFRHGPSR
ncbi:hypothetical protein AZA_51846 [Nitrospirillum viridazoti Y2]|nr:hypothetical protein AZA_51846 [Nitrospirillum amazonense Y2]